MEWFETEARRQIADTARRFAQNELLARDQGLDEEGKGDPPWEVLKQARANGFLSTSLPEALGGSALDRLSEIILWETLAGGSAGVAALMAIHSTGLHVLAGLQDVRSVLSRLEGNSPVDRGGNPSLVGLAIPESVVDIHRSFPPTGEDARTDRPCAVEGEFLCFPGPPAASHLVILSPARGDDAAIFWVDTGEALPFFTKSYPGSGLEEFPKGRLVVSPLHPVPGEIMCTGERAVLMAQSLLTHLRLSLGAIQIGSAHAAWQLASGYATERIQTGRPIVEHQEVRRMLLNMETLVETGRSLLYRAAACTGDLTIEVELAGMADRFCAGMAESVCLDAIQVLGGYGYMKDYGLEKRLRDCKTLQALLGSYPVDWLGQ